MYMTMNDCNELSSFGLGCKTTFDALSDQEAADSNASNYTDDMYAAAAIMIVAGVGYIVVRKRRVASIDLNQEEKAAENEAHFEMMSETGVRA